MTEPESSPLLLTVHVSRGPSPISLSTQEAWPVAAAITEYVNAYFKGGQHNRSVCPSVCVDLMLTLNDPHNHVDSVVNHFPVFPLLLQMSGENHGWPDHVLPSRHHQDFHSQPQRSCPQLQIGQHLKDRSLPAQSVAALQVCLCRRSSQDKPLVSCVWTRLLLFSTVIHLRVTPTPGTSGSTCRLYRSICREKLSSILRPRTTTLDWLSIRSVFWNPNQKYVNDPFGGGHCPLIRIVVSRLILLLTYCHRPPATASSPCPCHRFPLRIQAGLLSCCRPSASAAARWLESPWIITAAPPPLPPPNSLQSRCCCRWTTLPLTCSVSLQPPGKYWRCRRNDADCQDAGIYINSVIQWII